jgi:hypothetical protein
VGQVVQTCGGLSIRLPCGAANPGQSWLQLAFSRLSSPRVTLVSTLVSAANGIFTYSGDTLKYVKTKTHKNVTLSLPEPVLRRFRIFAAGHNQSMTSLMTRAIEKLMEHGDEYEKTKRRAIKRMHNAPNLGTNGKIPWKREDLYDR